MLTRDPLPLSADDLPQGKARRWIRERVADLQGSFTGSLRDPLHVQLPRNDVRMNVALAALLAVMLYIGALALLAHHVLSHAASGLDPVLQSRVTYEILPDTVKPQNRKLMDDRAAKLLGDLRKTAGIAKAEIMDQGKMAILLEPWLGTRAKLDDLPLPVLIDVQLSGTNPPTHEQLAAIINDLPGVSLDDHARFQGELMRFVSALRAVDVTVLLLTFVSLLLTSYFAAQATFHMNREVIELLHLIGANDQAIAQHMGITVVRLALYAAAAALVLAFLTLVGVWLNSHNLNLTFFPALTISFFDWLGLIVMWLFLMLGAALFCLMAVRFTVLRALRRLF